MMLRTNTISMRPRTLRTLVLMVAIPILAGAGCPLQFALQADSDARAALNAALACLSQGQIAQAAAALAAGARSATAVTAAGGGAGLGLGAEASVVKPLAELANAVLNSGVVQRNAETAARAAVRQLFLDQGASGPRAEQAAQACSCAFPAILSRAFTDREQGTLEVNGRTQRLEIEAFNAAFNAVRSSFAQDATGALAQRNGDSALVAAIAQAATDAFMERDELRDRERQNNVRNTLQLEGLSAAAAEAGLNAILAQAASRQAGQIDGFLNRVAELNERTDAAQAASRAAVVAANQAAAAAHAHSGDFELAALSAGAAAAIDTGVEPTTAQAAARAAMQSPDPIAAAFDSARAVGVRETQAQALAAGAARALAGSSDPLAVAQTSAALNRAFGAAVRSGTDSGSSLQQARRIAHNVMLSALDASRIAPGSRDVPAHMAGTGATAARQQGFNDNRAEGLGQRAAEALTRELRLSGVDLSEIASLTETQRQAFDVVRFAYTRAVDDGAIPEAAIEGAVFGVSEAGRAFAVATDNAASAALEDMALQASGRARRESQDEQAAARAAQGARQRVMQSGGTAARIAGRAAARAALVQLSERTDGALNSPGLASRAFDAARRATGLAQQATALWDGLVEEVDALSPGNEPDDLLGQFISTTFVRRARDEARDALGALSRVRDFAEFHADIMNRRGTLIGGTKTFGPGESYNVHDQARTLTQFARDAQGIANGLFRPAEEAGGFMAAYASNSVVRGRELAASLATATAGHAAQAAVNCEADLALRPPPDTDADRAVRGSQIFNGQRPAPVTPPPPPPLG